MGKFLVTTSMFLLGAAEMVWGGYVLSSLWNWFVAPTFGLVFLGTFQATGLKLLYNSIVAKRRKREQDEDFADMITDTVEGLAFNAMIYLFSLGFGALIHSWM